MDFLFWNMALLPFIFILLYQIQVTVTGSVNGVSIKHVYQGNILQKLSFTEKCNSDTHSIWYLYKNLNEWSFASQQMLLSTFPIDKERRNFVRKVENALFSVIHPTPLRKPRLAAVNEDVLTSILNLDPDVLHSKTFMKFVSGNIVLPGTKPLAHRYTLYNYRSFFLHFGNVTN